MKINGNRPPDSQDVNLKIRNINGAEPKGNVSSKEKNLTDRVDISGEGRDMAALMSAISKMPDIRTDKVNAIKKAIEAGNYNIDAAKIADKILKEL